MKVKSIFLAGLATAFAVVAFACNGDDADPQPTSPSEGCEQPIKVGMSWDLTGFNAASGVPERDGALLAVEEWKQRGGVWHDCDIELLARDDASDPAKSASIAREFVLGDVVAMVGSASSTGTIPLCNAAAESGVVLVGAAATIDCVKEGQDGTTWYFSTSTTVPVMADGKLPIIKELGLKRVAFIYTNVAFSQQLVDLQKKAIENEYSDMEIVADIAIDTTKNDLTTELIQLRSAAPDVIISELLAPHTVAFYRAVKQINWSPAPKFFTQDAFASEALQTLPIEDLDGAYLMGFADTESSKYQKEAAAFEDMYGRTPPIAFALGYDAMNVLLQAIDEVGPDRRAIRDRIAEGGMAIVVGGQDTVSDFSPEAYNSVFGPSGYTYTRIENGAQKPGIHD